MHFSVDPDKNSRNIAERGLSFTLAEQLDWFSALIEKDVRKNYSEGRFLALGLIGERLQPAGFTPRAEKVHIIGLRNANQQEVPAHEQKTRSRAARRRKPCVDKRNVCHSSPSQ